MEPDHYPRRQELSGVLVDCGPCPYLADRTFQAFHLLEQRIGGDLYRQLLDLGFRRSGDHVYRPVCQGCVECRPIRVAVATFLPRRDQRRCRTRNSDLTVTWQPRGIDDERRELYQRYQQKVHDDHEDHDHAGDFLIADSGVSGGELHARDATGALLGVSVCDHIGDTLSSVYCYYDPDQPRRSLGTFLALAEIDLAKQLSLDWWYLGFLVAGCSKMRYKARFGPHQVLIDGQWVDNPGLEKPT